MGRSKHIARRSKFLQEAQVRRQLRCRHIAGDVQAADLLTKPLDRKRFVALRRYLMNTDAMVEAPVEGRAAGRGTPDPMRQDGYVTPAGEKTVAESQALGIDDRRRNGTDHGGVSMPEYLGDCRSTRARPGPGSNH